MKSNSKKVVFASSIALLLLLLGVVFVSATPQLTINTVTWNTGTKVNISTKDVNDNSLINVTTITLKGSASNTVNSSTGKIYNITNTTATNFDFGYANFTINDALILLDSALWSVTAQTNGTLATSSATTVLIDRTKPEVNGISSPSSGVSTNLYTVTFGVRNTTQWKLIHNSNTEKTTSVTSSLSNTSGSQQISLSDSGSYYVQVSDGTNTTNSATITYSMAGNIITAKSTQAVAKAKVIQQQKKVESKKQTSNILLIGGAVIIFVVIAGILMTPKVKRRR